MLVSPVPNSLDTLIHGPDITPAQALEMEADDEDYNLQELMSKLGEY